MESSKTYRFERAQEAWRSNLLTAFRTALACIIVGGVTLYGPACITRQVTFPPFSYVTVMLILTNDPTLGETLRGSWYAFYATIQGIGPAILSLWLIGPARLTTTTTALAVAVSAFVVVLPESTHLVAKRIALGQIVIVYVMAFIKGGDTQAVMHPLHLAASTALGVLACVLALLLPYPTLAYCQVKKKCKFFGDNASERLQLFVKAFCAEDKPNALALISQAKLSALRGTKCLQIIKSKQESMQWERLPMNFFRPYRMNPGDKLQELNMPLRGMQIAITNTSSSSKFPIQILNQELKDDVLKLADHISQTLKKASPFDQYSSPSTVPEAPNSEDLIKSLQTLQNLKDLPSFFFLYCLKLLHKKSTLPTSSTKEVPNTNSSKQNKYFFKEITSKRLMPAFKCSLSLGLAVLFGLMYSKKDAHWSGLPVAITLAGAREATFKVANVKAQGTVLGTVYGVLGCVVFGKFVQIRFFSLLPWFIFTSFLRQSKMYGQAGGVSAIIGAVLILGRENFGLPREFAIARIVETFIGLSCSVMVEMLLQPTRASTLARAQLSKSLGAVGECVGEMRIGDSKTSLDDSQKRLKSCVSELGEFIGEAEVEPNFWFLPFHSGCYGKLLGSLLKIEELLVFGAHAIGFLEQEGVDKVLEGAHIEALKRIVCSSMKCFEEVILVKSLPLLDKELEKNGISHDVELGKSPSAFGNVEDEIEKAMSAFLQSSREVVDKVCVVEGENSELKTQVGLSLNALAFCMGSLVRETQEIEKGIKDILQWENPSSHINLHEISCKIHALYN
ncbi:SCO-spondin like [Actinidia chinensis var. chinensis]|uniref:SCO-spondin like n=1 Tax=Actinidia chinensis var. chinensis TaxID=1590841 RepID=A0A2R6P8A8_ACTCC|nr:SCO-spondin like [Actinidia chinensis var. chinensis]